jgi:hypothetical protein
MGGSWSIMGSSTMRDEEKQGGTKSAYQGRNGLEQRPNQRFKVFGPLLTPLATAMHPRNRQFLQDEIASGYV